MLDRLAQQGCWIKTAWASVVCSPSRAMMMTGCYAHLHKWWGNKSKGKCDDVVHGNQMKYSFREMRQSEVDLMIRYFLEADTDFLSGMGVDPEKLPSPAAWRKLLDEDFGRPVEQRQFYYLLWQADGVPVGHCNINKIQFGQSAFMHLHIWKESSRRSGCATQLLRPSILRFFDRFKLNELLCEPYAENPGPNRALPKVGFQLDRTYETTPGWIAFHQSVNRWVLHRETLEEGLQASSDGAAVMASSVEVVSRENAASYSWGDNCAGWHLLKHPSLSVIEEVMPAQCAEVRHFHEKAQQFFYVLLGTLTIEVHGFQHELHQHQGMHVPAGVPHEVKNRSSTDTTFLVISNPPSHADKVLA